MKAQLVASSALLFLACGGKAVLDDPLGGGGASSSATTTASTTSSETAAAVTVATSGGAPDCRLGGCSEGFVCHQPTGVCLRICDPANGESCLAEVESCKPCATPSCPGCEDCRAACIPANGSSICADHKDCPDSDLCVYSTNTCAKRCGTGSSQDVCAVGTCQQCFTTSCFGCDDCLSVCVGTNGG